MHITLTNVIALNVIRCRGVYNTLSCSFQTSSHIFNMATRTGSIVILAGPCKSYLKSSAHEQSDGMHADSVRKLAMHQTDHKRIKPEVVIFNDGDWCRPISI